MESRHDESFSEFFLSRSRDPALTNRVLTAIWPIRTRAGRGEFERVADSRFDAGLFRETIRGATGVALTDVTLLSVRDVMRSGHPSLEYGTVVEFNDSLAVALYRRHLHDLRPLIRERFGDGEREFAFTDGAWWCLKRDIGLPLGLAFWEDPWQTPRSSAGESLLTGLYYMLLAATLGDAERTERLLALVRLFGHAIPIGKRKEAAAGWLAVTGP